MLRVSRRIKSLSHNWTVETYAFSNIERYLVGILDFAYKFADLVAKADRRSISRCLSCTLIASMTYATFSRSRSASRPSARVFILDFVSFPFWSVAQETLTAPIVSLAAISS